MRGLSRLGDHSTPSQDSVAALSQERRGVGGAAGWVGAQDGLVEVDVIPAMHTRPRPQVS